MWVWKKRWIVRSRPPWPDQRESPRIVPRPVIDNIASATRRSWPNVVGSRHWLKHAKRTIISGMGGCSLCRVGLGNPYSTRGSTALPHLHLWRRYCYNEASQSDVDLPGSPFASHH